MWLLLFPAQHAVFTCGVLHDVRSQLLNGAGHQRSVKSASAGKHYRGLGVQLLLMSALYFLHGKAESLVPFHFLTMGIGQLKTGNAQSVRSFTKAT